jgi:uncharacterized membrane protein
MKKVSTARKILAITVGVIVYVILAIALQYLRSGEINWKGGWIINSLGGLFAIILVFLFLMFRPSPKEEKK